ENPVVAVDVHPEHVVVQDPDRLVGVDGDGGRHVPRLQGLDGRAELGGAGGRSGPAAHVGILMWGQAVSRAAAFPPSSRSAAGPNTKCGKVSAARWGGRPGGGRMGPVLPGGNMTESPDFGEFVRRIRAGDPDAAAEM